MENKLGCIAVGAYADILLVKGNPLDDLTVFKDAEKHIDLIMKNGEIVKPFT